MMATVMSYVKRNSPGGCWGTRTGSLERCDPSSARLAQNGISIHVVGLCPPRDERAEYDEPRPTVGTAAVLSHLGLVDLPSSGSTTIRLEEGVGPVEVELHRAGKATFARLVLENAVERPAERPSKKLAAAALSLSEDVVLEAWFGSAGLPFCFVHLGDRRAVDKAVLNRAAWSEAFARAWSPHLFFFAGELRPGQRLYARMFAPALGIEEDPATGSACAALMGTLGHALPDRDGTFTWQIDQGVAMGRPSLIEASAGKRGGKIVRITVGGAPSSSVRAAWSSQPATSERGRRAGV